MGIIEKRLNRIVISLIFGGVFSEGMILINNSASNSDSGLLFGTGFVFSMLVLMALCYWIPKYRMMKDMKNADSREDNDLLDD